MQAPSAAPLAARRQNTLCYGGHQDAKEETILRAIKLHVDRRPTFPGEGDDSLGGDKVDIDLLASQLSKEAEKLRQAQLASGSSIDLDDEPSESMDETLRGEALRSSDSVAPLPGGPFGYEEAARLLADIGDGGFSAAEFELLNQLGRLSWVVENAKENPLQVKGATSPEQTAVVAFTGRYYSGRPFQEPVTVFLKEYLPGASSVAFNELQVMKHLLGDFPADKWKAAVTGLTSVPVIPPPWLLPGGAERGGAKARGGRYSPDSVAGVSLGEDAAAFILRPG
eukprot:jgi/Botrbrau1/881/Bobra.0167s0006.1